MADGGRTGIAHLIEAGTHLAHPLVTPVVRIGRDPASDVLVRDATVSRLHAEVQSAFGVRTLTVVGSTGARVNDQRVEAPVALTHGDLVEIGSRRFIYHEGELPPGVVSYVGQGQDVLTDPLLARTTQSNPVVRPSDLPPAPKAPGGTPFGTIVLVVVALLFGFCMYLGGAPR
ncbi:MAG: FHA domain-containing protein [Gemmatimonadetes bacterium]|nr:FHA domain-containing protein [Gemmatimonadota bacterium]